MKNGTRLQIYGFLSVLDPNYPKLVFRPPDRKFSSFEIKNFVHAKLHTILHKTTPYFRNLDNFWQCCEGLIIPQNWKKKIHIKYNFWCHSRYVSSLSSLRKPLVLDLSLCLWKLKPGFWTYDLVDKFLTPIAPKRVFRPKIYKVCFNIF